jgi:hypothetical protein
MQRAGILEAWYFQSSISQDLVRFELNDASRNLISEFQLYRGSCIIFLTYDKFKNWVRRNGQEAREAFMDAVEKNKLSASLARRFTTVRQECGRG